MLPVELSTTQCSAAPARGSPGAERAARDRRHGDVVAQEFTRGVIRSAERMTYTAVHGVLEGDPALRERYGALEARFKAMQSWPGS